MGDDEGFFSLESSGHDEDGVLTAMLKTAADVVIDRETEVGKARMFKSSPSNIFVHLH